MATWKAHQQRGRGVRLARLAFVLAAVCALLFGLVFSGAVFSATSGSSLGLLLTIGMLMAGGGCMLGSLVALFAAARARGASAARQLDILPGPAAPPAGTEKPRRAA